MNATWIDGAHTAVRIDLGDGRAMTIPADVGNADYRRLVDGEVDEAGTLVVSPVTIAEPVPSAADYAEAVQAHLDAAARAHGYDSIHTAVSYAEEAEVPQYMADGRLFRRWRSKVWAKVFDLQSEGAAGTVEELIAALPTLESVGV